MLCPSYAEVCSEASGHTEAVLVLFDASVVAYARLAETLFDVVGDPTQLNRVGRDRGPQYRTGLYFHSPEQETEARKDPHKIHEIADLDLAMMWEN